MASQVLYRKWRPQTLAEVVGQEPVTRTLLNALRTSRLAHAYLFCGPRGTGKTSTGRILAKAMNCLSPQDGEPCNTCDICRAITEGRAFDLVEIDGASNRGIEEIRDIREKINFAPNVAKYKVYIIDEVHMLTEPAFNALLKTLEEPPAHAVFVLATTEVHKVPATILSRCQRFDFRRVPGSAIVQKLQQICEQEGIHTDTQSLTLIAKAATGSLRDAENLLEQVVLHHGTDVTLEEVREELGITDDERVRELAKHALKGDIAAGFATINTLSADGVDLRQFTRSLAEYLRGLLLIKAGAAEAVDLSPENAEEAKALVSLRSLNEISNIIKAFAQIDFRVDPQSTLPLELALVDCALRPKGEAEGRADRGAAKKKAAASGAAKEKPSAYTDERGEPLPDTTTTPRHSAAPVEQPVQEHSAVKETASATPAASSIPPPPHSLEQIREHWGDFVKACKGMGSSGNLDALLRSSCEVVDVSGNVLTLDFRYEFHKNKIEDPKYRHQVEVKLQEVFSVPYQVRCTQSKKEDSRPQPQQKVRHPVIDAAVRMGARIMEEEPKHDE
jgi:DNA polymerase-3 subunit gamma/tau